MSKYVEAYHIVTDCDSQYTGSRVEKEKHGKEKTLTLLTIRRGSLLWSVLPLITSADSISPLRSQ